MRRFRQPVIEVGQIASADVLWGVARREDHSDTDDPLAHKGLVQHAFLLGNDDRAICGFQAPKRLTRADRSPRAQLALAGTDNPRCTKCTTLIASATAPEGEESDEPAASTMDSAAGMAAADAQPAAPRAPEWSPRTVAPTAESEGDDESSAARPARRSSVRRGGRITVPVGRRSAVAELPAKARGAAIAAEVERGPSGVRVAGVTINDDGTARISLNRRAISPVEIVWFIVSPPRIGAEDGEE